MSRANTTHHKHTAWPLSVGLVGLFGQVGLIGLAVLALTACGSAGGAPHTGTTGMQSGDFEGEMSRLRSEQVSELAGFEAKMGSGDGQCGALCEHHTRICGLATRICTIADQNATHPYARSVCEKANRTCRDTTKRLPEDCYCR